jgi:hypothetical protein
VGAVGQPAPGRLGEPRPDEAFNALLAAFRARDEAGAREFCDQTRWVPKLPLSDALGRVSPEIRDGIRAALDTVSRTRTG